MQLSSTQTLLSLLSLLSSVLAADCIAITGVNTLDLTRANLQAEIYSTCADLRSGRPTTETTSDDELFTCRATSTAATYEFCEMALTNIASQCADVALGKFDFDFNGNVEHYEVQGHTFAGGALCSRSPVPAPESGKPFPFKDQGDVPGDPCLRKRKIRFHA